MTSRPWPLSGCSTLAQPDDPQDRSAQSGDVPTSDRQPETAEVAALRARAEQAERRAARAEAQVADLRRKLHELVAGLAALANDLDAAKGAPARDPAAPATVPEPERAEVSSREQGLVAALYLAREESAATKRELTAVRERAKRLEEDLSFVRGQLETELASNLVQVEPVLDATFTFPQRTPGRWQ